MSDGGNEMKSAQLYALDGATGEPLWDSGNRIRGHSRGPVLSAGPTHVYLTDQSAVYAFGFPIEH